MNQFPINLVVPFHYEYGFIARSVRCQTAGPGVASFTEIDHEMICMAILLLSADSRRVVVSNKRKYVHKVLANGLVKLAQEKSVVS